MRKSPIRPQETPQETPDDNAVDAVVDAVADVDVDDGDSFDLSDLPADAKTEVRRLNPDTGNFALVGILPGPSSWETVARKWGGGMYKVTVKRDGRFGRQRTFEIDSAVWPPGGVVSAAGAARGAENPLTVDADRATLQALAADLAELRRSVSSRGADLGGGGGLKDLLEMVKMLRQAETGTTATGILDTLKMGIELGKGAVGGAGEGRGLADVVAEIGPQLLKLVGDRNTMAFEAEKMRRASGPQSARKVPTDDGRRWIVVQLQKLVDASRAGVDPADAADSASDALPPMVLDQVVEVPLDVAVQRLCEILPGEREYLTRVETRDWIAAFVARLKGEDVPRVPGDGAAGEGLPGGDSGR